MGGGGGRPDGELRAARGASEMTATFGAAATRSAQFLALVTARGLCHAFARQFRRKMHKHNSQLIGVRRGREERNGRTETMRTNRSMWAKVLGLALAGGVSALAFAPLAHAQADKAFVMKLGVATINDTQ